MKRSLFALAFVIVAAIVGVAVLRTNGDADFFERETKRLREITVPSDGELSESTGILQERFQVRSTWTLTTEMPWVRYQTFLRGQLRGNYEVHNVGESHIDFRRDLKGDVLFIRANVTQDSKPTKITITFSGFAS